MKFASAVLSLATLAVPCFAQTYSLTYDTLYDNNTLSLDYVACSDGTYGLITKGFTTVGELPTWPFVGGVYAVTGWDSAACGTCWEVTYGNTTLAVTAIDTAADGFNLSLEAMNALTGELAEELGRVEVTATQVASSVCGITS
ncbi:Cerato-platanin [Leucogyrophana mollusca]|uniref:Cerato-platanin n=1 Tax=Leucogyrophana mollusca TaxID=85980 RepID=A0ACB8B5J9_9AGAM|nr:Cerato-platanin [Leucogyrophana mollusca]